jgi:hypothetical protein
MATWVSTSLRLALALLPSLAAAQQPLVIDPTLPSPLDALRAAAPPPLGTPGAGGLRLPEVGGATVAPSLTPSTAPDPIPADRRQDRVPTLRLKLPL